MSEKLHSSQEHKHNSESLDLAAESRRNLENIHKKAEKVGEHTEEHVEQAKSKVETQAVSGKEYTVGEKETTHSSSHRTYNQKQLKAESFDKTIKHIRKKLPKNEKAFSKVIHNKKIEAASEIGAKTVARPSGILGGGIAALLGSLFLLVMAKYYGFEYNFFAFILLFVSGFFIGSAIEILIRSTSRRSRN
jgi:Fe2+ transport system protein B